MKDRIIRGMDESLSFRVFVIIGTEMVEEARRVHNTTPVATLALGRLLMGTSMMGQMIKEEDGKVSVEIKCGGPAKQLLAVANSSGNVKGYIANPDIDLPLNEKGKLDVGSAVGKGKLVVIKDIGLKEPYIGRSNLVNGEIAEDLTAYFAYSEQQPSAVALGVFIDQDNSVKSAGGLIVQVMPNPDEEALAKLESILANMESISTIIHENKEDSEALLKAIFGDLGIHILAEKEVGFVCDCSRERMEKALISLGKEELGKLLEEDENIEIVCHFCNLEYNFDKEAIQDLLTEIS